MEKGEGVMIRLSLCIITKDEEKNIARCLKSVEGLVNEIILVDTGSTDGTIEIAKTLNANVFEHRIVPFSFAKARNYALNRAFGSWILTMDADEELPQESIPKIEKIIETDNREGYICNLFNFLPEGESGHFKSIRLFKSNPEARYIRRCHEEISFSLYKLKYKIVESGIKIIHHGYNATKDVLNQKAKRNLELLSEMYQKNPHWLTAYQIGQSYIALEKNIIGKQYLRIAVKDPKITPDFKREILNLITLL